MKQYLNRLISLILTVIILLSALPIVAFSENVAFDTIVNAATYVIIKNEGFYDTVLRNDNGALSIGKLGWHATNALELLKRIVAEDSALALSILGASLYNEIITSRYWETKIPSREEAAVISVLISTTHGRRIQDESAREYISGYVEHAMELGITEPRAMVFFADFNNQNGYSGSASFYREVKRTYGEVTLQTLYECSSKNNRRTRTYNFCVSLNWNDYLYGPTPSQDLEAPKISNVKVDSVSVDGYTVSCDISDNIKVTTVYFAVFRRESGEDSAKWYSQTPTDSNVSHTVDITEFGKMAGDYCTIIYAFDASGNFAYAALNIITVPDASSIIPPLAITVSAENEGLNKEILWKAEASGGSGNYDYSFDIYCDGKLVNKRSKNDLYRYSFTPETTGEYYAIVTVFDRASGESAHTESAHIKNYHPIEANKLSSDKQLSKIGEVLSWQTSASGGEGDLEYSFTVFNGNTIVYATEYINNSSFKYKTTTAGNYYALVNIRDSKGQVVSKKSPITVVYKPLSIDSLTFDKSFATPGATITAQANVSANVGNTTYKFTVYLNDEVYLESHESSDNTFMFIASNEGAYTVYVQVKDASNTQTKKSDTLLTVSSTPLRGDANGDGVVTALDARLALRCAIKLEEVNDYILAAADLDSNGKISANDARKILRLALRLPEN